MECVFNKIFSEIFPALLPIFPVQKTPAFPPNNSVNLEIP